MKKTLSLIFSTLISAGLISLCFLTPCFSTLWQIIFTVVISLTLIAIFVTSFTLKKFYKTAILFLILEVAVIAVYMALYYSGLLVHFKDEQTLRAWIESFGAWGPIVFFILELAQVVLIPFPAQITTLAGVWAFGSLKAFFISSAAVISGSIIAFAIGRSLGVPVLYKISNKEKVDKYRKIISKKGRMLLPIMFLFPMFPDDLLCFIAGTTTMSWTYFIVVTLATRLIGIGCLCLFLGGDIIPFSGWGIPVWIVLVTLLVTAALIMLKYQDKIEQFIINLFTRQKKSKKEELQSAQTEHSDDYVTFAEQSKQDNKK